MIWMTLGFPVLMLGLGTAWAYLLGVFNPLGHLGDTPWRSKKDTRPGHCRYCGSDRCIGRWG